MNRPTVFELECFVAVVEEGNFSKAARRLHLTQPPLSRQIRALEEKLQTRLFDRNTRSVRLTAPGEMLRRDAVPLLLKLDATAEAVRRAELGEDTRLRISFVGSLLDESFMQVVQQFRARHPRCQVHLVDVPPGEQMVRIADGSVDLAFVGALPQRVPKGLRSVVWKREPLCLVLPFGHRLFLAKSAALRDLAGESWVMVSRQAAPAFRSQFESLCRMHGYRPRIVEETERVPAVLAMVAAGQGISLLPAGVRHLLSAGPRFLPVRARPAPALEHACLYQAGQLSPEVSAFLEILPRLRSAARKAPPEQASGEAARAQMAYT